MSDALDLIVIGAGPGGYVAAIRAAQLGLKTALVEKEPTLGGVCLNVGCIPSKALLHSTEMFAFAAGHAAEHGIQIEKPRIDVKALMKRKDGVVERLVGGVKMLVEKRGIEVVRGTASLTSASEVVIKEGKKERKLKAKRILLATGSSSVELPFMKFDRKTVVSSDEAIAFTEVPQKLVVVGAGAIGLELGSVWSRLGSEVTVLEFLPRIAATYDPDVSKLAERIFKKQGMKFHTDTKVTGVKRGKGKTLVTAESKGKSLEFEADKVLVAVGRRPNTSGLGLEDVGVRLSEGGRVEVDAHFQTSVKGVFAIGDLIAGPMLAHKAEEDGIAAVELMAGRAGHVDYGKVPNVIYTDPEIASVGLTEVQAKEKGLAVKVGTFPLAANGRAIATDATDGFFKVIADEDSDRLLGVQIVARHASELIAAAVTHMEYGGSAEDVARTVHAHPTLSEAFKEAALAVSKSAIHSL